MRCFHSILILSVATSVSGAEPSARLLAAGRIAADARDAEGETIGSIGSAIEILPSGQIVMLSDRGAGDGTIDYRPRWQLFTMTRNGAVLDLQPGKTVILRDSNARPFTGLFPDLTSAEPPRRRDGRMCLDPEGLAVATDGHVFIAEEYHPSIREFASDGSFLRRFATPDEVLPATAQGRDFANDKAKKAVSGREPNRGFEGLTFLPDGRLAAILQSGLAQDGGREAGFVRLFLFDATKGKPVAAYRVPFSPAGELEATAPPGDELKARHLVFCALATLPDGRLLALERDNHGADGSDNHGPARWKAVVLLDLRGAEDILGRADVAGAAPVGRTVLFNLAALDTASLGLPREELPAKWEGLAVAGIEGDRLRLLLSSDNDFLAPTLYLRGSDDTAPAPVKFPRAERAQDTWIIEVETDFPPLSASRSATPSIVCT
ncbi:MAG: esterase-like activity of phytase family protein [Chthoniobacterales bacterium]